MQQGYHGTDLSMESHATEDECQEKLTIVVFGGHPDDPESCAGGLIATLTQAGHKVISAYGTAFRGNRKFFDRPEAEVRREEGIAACKTLGATPKFFDYSHEGLCADKKTLAEISDWLDEVNPDIVVTHWPIDMHPNHVAISTMIFECYKREGGWNLYYFEAISGVQTLAFKPELYFDIVHVREIKERGLLQHTSQDPEAVWALHEKMHRQRGEECGVAHAEAYLLLEAKPSCPLLPVDFLNGKAGAWTILSREDLQ